MWKKSICSIMAGVLFFAFLTGCGASTIDRDAMEQSNTENAEDSAASEAKQPTEAPKEPYDLMTQEWKATEELENSDNWWKVTDYIDNMIQPQEGKESFLRYSVVDGSDFYVLVSYDIHAEVGSSVIDPTEHYVNHLDTETMEVECNKLPPHERITESTAVAGLAASDGRLMIFVQEWNEEDRETIHYYGLLLNADGTWEEAVDLLPALEQGGLKLEAGTIYSNGQWDSQGYFYFTDETNTRVCVIDENGALLETLECEIGQTLVSKCKSPEGILIWEKENQEADKITYFFYEKEGIQLLYGGAYEFVSKRCMNSYGEIMYVYKSALVRWNAATGQFERLFVGTGMESKRYANILQNSEGKIIIVDDEGDKFSVTSYSLAGPAKTVELTLLVRGYCDYATRTYIDEFVRRHPGIRIEIQETEFDNRDTEWTRLIAELSAGKGPELILLDRAEMLVLQEKGVLADLSDVLPKELEEQIFQGVLDYGRVDDRLYGLTYQASFSTLMVSKDIWQKPTWTVEDVLQVMKTLEEAGTPVESFCNGRMKECRQTGEQMLFSLLYDLEHSPFLDLEKGECYFDTDLFCELLTLCKEYGVSDEVGYGSIGNTGEYRKYVKNGQGLAYRVDKCSLSAFSEDMASFKDNYICVGYPTEGESGSYWECNDMLAVNAKAKEREIIDELLQYLYSKECQMDTLANTDIIVRRDLLVDSVVGYVDWSDVPVQRLSAYAWADLAPKPDGSTYLEEYLALLDSCVVAPGGAEEIERILSEEVPAFFNDDKDAEAVAEIVQRRAQLYLFERK